MNLVPCFCFLHSIYYDSYSVILLLLLLLRAHDSTLGSITFRCVCFCFCFHFCFLYFIYMIFILLLLFWAHNYGAQDTVIPGTSQACDSAPGSIAFGCIHFCFLHSIYMILILLFCYFCYCFGPIIPGPKTLWFQAHDSAPGSIALWCVIFRFLHSIYIFIWFIFCWSVTSVAFSGPVTPWHQARHGPGIPH